MTSKPTPIRLTVAEAATYCGVTKQYLYQCRSNGVGPKCQRIQTHGLGKGPSLRLAYLKSDLDAWNAARKPKSASKPARKKQQRKKAA
jgi:hypothetical protein